MRTEEYIVSKDSDKNEHKTRITRITGINEIIDEVNSKDQLHDWTLEYISCNGTEATITTKSYENETLFRFHIRELNKYNIDLDIVSRWLFEIEFEIKDDIKIVFDGVGIEMRCKEITLDIQERIS